MIDDNVEKEKCPLCKSDVIMYLSSMKLKICYDCGHEYAWVLKEDTLPLVKHQRG